MRVRPSRLSRPSRRHRLALLALLALPALLAGACVLPALSGANTSHAGWPPIDGELIMHKQDESGEIRGPDGQHNELLGGHGDDTIYAGNAGDVLWGDYKPSGQPKSQVDHLYGGPGNDFIYASHGTNYIHTGAGRNVVHAHFGRGEIHCDSERDVVYLSHHSRRHYRLFGCQRISFKTVGY